MIELLHLYTSREHNYFGHHGKEPGDAPMIEQDELECVAGRGLRGDRFFDYKESYKGQITFFASEVYADLCRELNTFDRAPSVLRRNVITAGIDLTQWYNVEFEIQGVRFRGRGECAPCYWMEQAFAPGAEAALRGRGGLRAVILTSGPLRATTIPAAR